MNINLVLGLIIFLILLFIFGILWARSIHPFWSSQPVFYIYNLKYLLFPPGIIDHKLPLPNKFCDFYFTQTITMKTAKEIISEKMKYKSRNKTILNDSDKKDLFFAFSPELLSHFTKFLQKYQTFDKNIIYKPTTRHLFSYFQNHNHPCYLTLWSNNIHTLKTKDFRNINGYITSRPVEMWLDGYSIIIYFMDYLCTNSKVKIDYNYRKNPRNKNFVSKLIQSHIYKQRHNNKSIDITLFRKDSSLRMVIPFITYITYGFKLHYWKLPKSMHTSLNMLRITPDNFYYCREILNIFARLRFSCCIYPTMGNILTRIKAESLIMISLLHNKDIIALYIFEDPKLNKKMELENKPREIKIIDCIASISKCKDINLFILGFHKCMLYLRKKQYGFLRIQNISNNDHIIENILTKYTPDLINKSSYYFHNFAYHTKKSNDTLIIS